MRSASGPPGVSKPSHALVKASSGSGVKEGGSRGGVDGPGGRGGLTLAVSITAEGSRQGGIRTEAEVTRPGARRAVGTTVEAFGPRAALAHGAIAKRGEEERGLAATRRAAMPGPGRGLGVAGPAAGGLGKPAHAIARGATHLVRKGLPTGSGCACSLTWPEAAAIATQVGFRGSAWHAPTIASTHREEVTGPLRRALF